MYLDIIKSVHILLPTSHASILSGFIREARHWCACGQPCPPKWSLPWVHWGYSKKRFHSTRALTQILSWICWQPLEIPLWHRWRPRLYCHRFPQWLASRDHLWQTIASELQRSIPFPHAYQASQLYDPAEGLLGAYASPSEHRQPRTLIANSRKEHDRVQQSCSQDADLPARGDALHK